MGEEIFVGGSIWIEAILVLFRSLSSVLVAGQFGLLSGYLIAGSGNGFVLLGLTTLIASHFNYQLDVMIYFFIPASLKTVLLRYSMEVVNELRQFQLILSL